MNISFIGWGIEAKSAYHYFGPNHHYVIVSEEAINDAPEGVTTHVNTEHRTPGLSGNSTNLSYLSYVPVEESDLIIYQPSAAKNMELFFGVDHSIWQKAKTIQHIFFEQFPNPSHIIGVTGTKGKGTTSSLIYEILKETGFDVRLAGNIGLACLDVLPNTTTDTYAVLELSSFQLYRFPYSPHIAVHLMMIPEHIAEWHKTMDDYVNAKRNIFLHQSADDIAIYFAKNKESSQNATTSKGKKIPYFESPGAYIENNMITIDTRNIISVDDVGLRGAHNLQNICAAVTACWPLTKNIEAIARILKKFTGLEHRLEAVAQIDHVLYVDDSFGTTPDTAVVAMDAFPENKVMIVGGHDKGSSFEEMAKRLSNDDISHVVFIGSTANKLLSMALNNGFDIKKAVIKDNGNSWTMPEIVKTAQHLANSGEVVLLSTGCASFGIFSDYKDRGNQFKTCVQELEKAASLPPLRAE